MAVDHDEGPTRRQLISSVADVPREQNGNAMVAEQVAPLLAMQFGGGAGPLVFLDASARGPEDGPGTVLLRSARVLTRCSEFVRQSKEQVACQRRAQAGADDVVSAFARSFEQDEQLLAREGAGMATSAKPEQQIEHVGDIPVIRHAERLVVVVGFDGSESAYRALDAAALLISGRIGTVEVVYVAHIAAGAEMSATALTESLTAFDSAELEFADAVRDRLADIEFRWRFRRRDGPIAHELIAVADELRREYGDDSQVVIVVGSAMHSLHHVVGSVPVALVRHAKYPILVVP
jgi:nucleotide-binding universal stress UspA family protein